MYRIIELGNVFYGKLIENFEEEKDDIELFLSEGRPVLLVEDLADLDDYICDISSKEICLV